jgi:cytochrome d ubiquinol oxidase subunit II
MVAAFTLFDGLAKRRQATPFLAAMGLFVLCFIGLGISFYPYILPPSLTISAAAAPDASLKFLLLGAAILIPIIMCYMGFAYWTFRGKVDPTGGYK